MGRVERERGAKKGPGPSPERVLELVQEAREVAEQFGCPVVVNAPGENGTASIPIGKTPELTAFTPEQQHVIFVPGKKAQVFPAKSVTTSSVVDTKPAVLDSEIPAINIPTEPRRNQVDRKRNPQKPRTTHNLKGLTGFWKGTFYRDGVAQNGNNGHGNHKKR